MILMLFKAVIIDPHWNLESEYSLVTCHGLDVIIDPHWNLEKSERGNWADDLP